MTVSFAQKLEQLSAVFKIDGDVEHMLHELCHVVLFNDESLIDRNHLDDNISGKFHDLSVSKADWNEILTIACELVVLETKSFGDYRRLSAYSIASNASFYTMDRLEVERRALRHTKTQVTRRRAKAVKDLINRTWHRYCKGAR